MIGRRTLLLGSLAAFAALQARAEEPILTDDGLYKQPWFLESFLDLADDLEAAHKDGKRFVIMWELRGCPYCKETHLVNFAQPQISEYVKSNFEVLQLNIIGSRKVTDFDGREMSEKALALKYGIRFTPTFQFFGESATVLKDLPPLKREVNRAAGYMLPRDFLAMFRFVREKAYETKNFRQYLKELQG
ncbi:MAG TPA: thioredoxin family protein [Pseudolabrys sp.]|nr:thioredoxin family protein [Pseudolabrys sp.]